MCRYITATLSHDTDLDALRPVIRDYGVPLTPVRNGRVEEQLPRGTVYLSATGGMCDCGTILGRLRRDEASSPGGTRERDRHRLRKKGWGEARIARWEEERKAIAERDERLRMEERNSRFMIPG